LRPLAGKFEGKKTCGSNNISLFSNFFGLRQLLRSFSALVEQQIPSIFFFAPLNLFQYRQDEHDSVRPIEDVIITVFRPRIVYFELIFGE
jgi:hypothetical protein